MALDNRKATTEYRKRRASEGFCSSCCVRPVKPGINEQTGKVYRSCQGCLDSKYRRDNGIKWCIEHCKYDTCRSI